MAFWKAYIDESGTHTNDGLKSPIVAAVVGDVVSWKRLLPIWVAILRKYGLTNYHGTDFNVGAKGFEVLHKDKKAHTKCHTELIDLLAEVDIEYIVWTLEQEIFDTVMSNYPDFKLSIYDFLLSNTISQLELWAEERTDVEGVRVVIESGCDQTCNISRKLIDHLNESDGYKLKNTDFENKKYSPGFEVVDMLAYESFQYSNPDDEKRPPRMSFVKITKGHKPTFYSMRKEALPKNIEGIREALSRIK